MNLGEQSHNIQAHHLVSMNGSISDILNKVGIALYIGWKLTCYWVDYTYKNLLRR